MCDVCSYEDWLDDIAEQIDLLDGLSEAAYDFAVSVEEKLSSMAEWIEQNEHITPKQILAIQNMKAGIERWQR